VSLIVFAVFTKRVSCDQSAIEQFKATQSVGTDHDDSPKKCTSDDADLKSSQCFPQLRSLNYHQKRLAGKMPYKCQYCDKSFRMMSGLHIHEQRIHYIATVPSRQLKRSLVRKVSNETYGNVRTQASDRSVKLSCKFCGLSFANAAILLQHERRHTGEKPYSCNACGFLFFRRISLVRHVKKKACGKSLQLVVNSEHSVVNRRKKKFRQRLVDREVASKERLVEGSKASAVDLSLSCAFCLESFGQSIDLYNHYKRCHWSDVNSSSEDIGSTRERKPTLAMNDGMGKRDVDSHSSVSSRTQQKRSLKSGIVPSVHEVVPKLDPYSAVTPPSVRSSSQATPAEHRLERATRRAKLQNPENPRKCQYCRKEFKCLVSRRFHERQMHNDDDARGNERSNHICKYCGKRSSTKSSLNEHLQTHIDVNRFTCEVCNKEFSYQFMLRNHSRIHTGEKPYECQWCNKKFTCKLYLKQHAKIHAGVEPRASAVSANSQRTRSKTDVRMHDAMSEDLTEPVVGVASKTNQYFLLAAKSTTESATIVPSHNLRESAYSKTNTNTVQCKYCNKAFKFVIGLRLHERRMHAVETRKNQNQELKEYHVCEFCDRRLTTYGSLIKHLQTHTAEKPYVCDVCSSAFPTNGRLLRHSRTHGSDKPFVCYLCYALFKSSGALKRHIQILHSSKPPYACHLCNKTFSWKYLLKRHLLSSHSIEWPYACHLCDATFTVDDYLSRHLRNQHSYFSRPIGFPL